MSRVRNTCLTSYKNFFYVLIYSGIARIAVPLFFIMSGYLFFLSFSWSLESYKKKISSRVQTLLVPFLFWSCSALGLLALAQAIPSTRVYFSGDNLPISKFGIYDYLNGIFGINGSPIAYQFWFIRDLMVIVLLTPVIGFVLRMLPRISLMGLFLLWFLNVWPVQIPSVEALTFFCAGAYISSSNISLFALDRFGLGILFSYAAVLAVDVASNPQILIASNLVQYKEFNPYIHNIGVVLGVASALFISKVLVGMDKARKILLWTGSCSFFVFAIHEPWLRMVKKVFYKFLVPTSNLTVLALDLLIPTLVICLSIALYAGMRVIAPRFLNVITGGR